MAEPDDMNLTFLLPLFAQVGPAGAMEHAPLEIPRAKKASAPVIEGRLARCIELARSAPLEAIEETDRWLAQARGSARADPGECKGLALSRLERWAEAAIVFATAHDDTPVFEQALRARRGAMAGNAALAAGQAEAALAALDSAHGEARRAKDNALAGGIALDRARTLVALNRIDEAASALAEARGALPADAQAWLLSATLSRRLGKLPEAQGQIEQAANLDPRDPAIGLEAGVIAMLAGREDAARKSWKAVIALAPDGAEARTARDYLEQLGLDPSGKPAQSFGS
jgi:tetratricopeptide (TPR) repeat protein